MRGDDPGRPGLPPARRRRLPAGQEVTRRLSAADAGATAGRRRRRRCHDHASACESIIRHRRPLFGQLLVGLINGSFYALLSLGLAVIFGMLNIINFAHGAQYMMGAFVAYLPAATICRHRLLVRRCSWRRSSSASSASSSSARCCSGSTSSIISTACC